MIRCCKSLLYLCYKTLKNSSPRYIAIYYKIYNAFLVVHGIVISYQTKLFPGYYFHLEIKYSLRYDFVKLTRGNLWWLIMVFNLNAARFNKIWICLAVLWRLFLIKIKWSRKTGRQTLTWPVPSDSNPDKMMHQEEFLLFFCFFIFSLASSPILRL